MPSVIKKLNGITALVTNAGTASVTFSHFTRARLEVIVRHGAHPVSIRISLDDELRIYSNENLAASHRLRGASSGWLTVPQHHPPLWHQAD